ncbi:glyoxalase/bleomycin resistance protein [Legionella sainthelensi]|uniref:Glyoxalase/bleomycin resistance protein n=1 Tax=Legionella sainthelensi TaxID=28087 RepID=A0A0W0YBV5_9GAMM|nr:VOC family protein [Legionella sainthelensi]AUH73050.1 VOC family protein [Legionella sainthelensi]KTD54365.1 glyoxalase/bleomycin resistance protein [Legionella sainthelensi]VEB36028.1 glyoxalase/bleomycin resistance protein [Legionella sainthelensi]VEH32997.1 glyoxalase/bleomycin resistance protein [Legionella sainthelensi]
MILDHVGITVANYERSKNFYCSILKPLGITLVKEQNQWAGFGKQDKPEFWFGEGKRSDYFSHITFVAENKKAVEQFYTIALQQGATCNGEPKYRTHYYPNYYGAFIIDPDGHYIGAIMHTEMVS